MFAAGDPRLGWLQGVCRNTVAHMPTHTCVYNIPGGYNSVKRRSVRHRHRRGSHAASSSPSPAAACLYILRLHAPCHTSYSAFAASSSPPSFRGALRLPYMFPLPTQTLLIFASPSCKTKPTLPPSAAAAPESPPLRPIGKGLRRRLCAKHLLHRVDPIAFAPLDELLVPTPVHHLAALDDQNHVRFAHRV